MTGTTYGLTVIKVIYIQHKLKMSARINFPMYYLAKHKYVVAKYYLSDLHLFILTLRI